IVGTDDVTRVDLLALDELIDLDRACGLERDVLELVLRHLEVAALVDLITLDDVVVGNLLAGLRVDADVFDAMAGVLVDLIEADFLGVGGSGIERHRTGHEREAEKTFPVGTRGHTQYSGFGILDSSI